MNMDRAIFDLKISMEATSAYILICALMDEGHPPDLKTIRSLWNGTEDSLQAALHELTERRVVEVVNNLDHDTPVSVNAADQWTWRLETMLPQ